MQSSKEKKEIDKTYIANIFTPRAPIISGMPSIVCINENNNCKLIVENCMLCNVTIERSDLIGLLEIEEENVIPLTDEVISSVCTDIYNRFPKSKRKGCPEKIS